MEIGDECIYRSQNQSPSERVRIVDIQQGKKSFRADIEFLDGDKAGARENIPGNRLRGLWSEVAEYDRLTAHWQALSEYDLTEIEESAVERVFDLLVPSSVATWEWNSVRFATAVHDAEALMHITGKPTAEIITDIAWFDLNGVLMLSPEGTIMIAELACRKNPVPILEWIIEEEKIKREQCKRGGKSRIVRGGDDVTTSPEWEYELYLKYYRPLHEILRQWCGHRAVTLQERLAAAETESHRLDVLVSRLIDVLKKNGDELFAKVMEEEHETERITSEKLRPVVERPLHPSEIPVRYVRVNRRWS